MKLVNFMEEITMKFPPLGRVPYLRTCLYQGIRAVKHFCCFSAAKIGTIPDGVITA